MQIPEKITPCPVIECIIEMRFSTNIPNEAILGIVYNEFNQEFPEIEQLPILQIPEQLRSNDPNLKFKPTHKLSKDNMLIQIGPKLFSLVNTNEYIGWKSFSKEIYKVFGKLFSLIKLNQIHRVAVRYINLFNEINIFDRSNLKITLNDKPMQNNDINLTSIIKADGCSHRLLIVNNSEVIVNSKHYKGSLIDIDTVLESCPTDMVNDINSFKDCIEKAHIEEKKLFFSLIQESFLKTLNPEYQ